MGNSDTNDSASNKKTEEFLHLLMGSHQRIYAFILTLVPNTTDADDLMQKTTTTMWQKFSQFTPGSDFVAWGISIAHKKVLEHRRKHATSHVKFDNELLKIMVVESNKRSDITNAKLDALDKCIDSLGDEDRKIVQMRYKRNITVNDLAKTVGKSVFSIYRTFARIHSFLIRCMNRKLAVEGIS